MSTPLSPPAQPPPSAITRSYDRPRPFPLTTPTQTPTCPGAKNVVVTLGSKGCMLVSAEGKGCAMFSTREKVVAKDTVGAGDAFLGSLGSYLARGLTLEAAVGKAVRCAKGERTKGDGKMLRGDVLDTFVVPPGVPKIVDIFKLLLLVRGLRAAKPTLCYQLHSAILLSYVAFLLFVQGALLNTRHSRYVIRGRTGADSCIVPCRRHAAFFVRVPFFV